MLRSRYRMPVSPSDSNTIHTRPLCLYVHVYLYSMLLGKLCGKLCFGPAKPKNKPMVRRQTSDTRVRVGASAIGMSARSFCTSLYAQYNLSLAPLREPLEPGDVELESTVVIETSTSVVEELKADPELGEGTVS